VKRDLGGLVVDAGPLGSMGLDMVGGVGDGGGDDRVQASHKVFPVFLPLPIS
jgi:hypothetical protein